MANACCFSRCQAPVQAFFRPGIWLPGIRNLHLSIETWELPLNPQDSFDAIVAAVNSIAEEENLLIRKENKSELFLEIWSFTATCNWLDVVDIRFHQEPDSTVTLAEARSFSTGLIPACFPLAFIFNCILFWAPFSGNNFNSHRLEAIRTAAGNIKLKQQGPDCC